MPNACANERCPSCRPPFGTREWFLASPFFWEHGEYARTSDTPEGPGWRYDYVARNLGTCTETRLTLHVAADGSITDESAESELPALVSARRAERRRAAKLVRDALLEATARGAPVNLASLAGVADEIEALASCEEARSTDAPAQYLGESDEQYAARVRVAQRI